MIKDVYLIAKEFFYVFTGSLIIFIAMELAWQGIVLAYININFVLILWLIAGIVLLVLNDKKQSINKD